TNQMLTRRLLTSCACEHLYWLCYRHNNQISVVIEPGASLIHARMRAALALQVTDCVGSCSSRLQQSLVLGLMQYGYYIIKCENPYSGDFSISVEDTACIGP